MPEIMKISLYIIYYATLYYALIEHSLAGHSLQLMYICGQFECTNDCSSSHDLLICSIGMILRFGILLFHSLFRFCQILPQDFRYPRMCICQ